MVKTIGFGGFWQMVLFLHWTWAIGFVSWKKHEKMPVQVWFHYKDPTLG
jgi:hypothetical protein